MVVDTKFSATSTLTTLTAVDDVKMVEDDAERVDWGNDDDEQQAAPESYPSYSPRQATGGYAGEDAEDAVSLGGDDEDEREFYGHHSVEQPSAGEAILLPKSASVAHNHTTKRDNQRQSTTSSQHTRAPSQTKNSESPTSGLRRTHSASNIPPPLTHALPPKPVVAPPHFRPSSPAGPGILASAMVHRQQKSNGSLRASDGGDPLPPDWEIRQSRTGNETYFFNVKTEESTWVRPKLPPSGRSSPVKDRESGPLLSGRRSPVDFESALLDKSAKGQGARNAQGGTPSRNTSPLPPAGDLTYHDRHYRPGEAPAPAGKGDAGDRRSERTGVKPVYLASASYARTRSPSPDNRRRPRSTSPRERVPRRDLSPAPLAPRGGLREASRDFSQDRLLDASWGRSEPDRVDNLQSSSRSPPNRRPRRKDDIEPPLRRRRDDIEPPLRRKDDIEPPIRRKDDAEPWARRKDDIEPPLRRRDDVEPPIRPLPRKEPTTRHANANAEWPPPRTRSPPPHFREPSPPRRSAPSSFPPPGEGLLTPSSSNPRDSTRFGRGNSPPPRYPPRDLPSYSSTDNLPQRRTRDNDLADDAGYDQTKRRRLNEDLGPPRRPPSDLPPHIASLPPKPIGAGFPVDSSSIDASHRKRAPLPPQDQQWRENRHGAPPPGPYANAPAVAPGPQGGRFAPPPLGDVGRRPFGATADSPTDRREDRFRAPIDDVSSGSRRTGRSPPRDFGADRERRPIPTGPGDRQSRFGPIPSPVERSERMEVDGPPSKTTPAPRSTMGGMHADRMLAEPPRGPRAMARDGPGAPYASGPPGGAPPQSSTGYNARPSMPPPIDTNTSVPGRGRGGPTDRRWETNDSERRASFSGPPSREPSTFPPRRVDEAFGGPRDLPDRPGGRAPPMGDRRDDRPPPRISGTNNIPVGAKPSGYVSDHTAPNPTRSPVERFCRPDDLGDRLRGPPQGGSESYDRRPPLPSGMPPSDPPRGDRMDRRPSFGQDGPARGRGAEPIINRSPNALPARPRDAHVDPASPPLEPRIWQTRDEAQSSRPPEGFYIERDTRMWPEAWKVNHTTVDRNRLWSIHDPTGPRYDMYNNTGPRTRSPEVPFRPRPASPPPTRDVRPHDDPLIEHPATGKVHPERARLLSVQTPDDADRSSQPVRLRRPERSPEQGYSDRPRFGDIDRDLPPRPADTSRLPPARERSPPPSQNGHRPPAKRGGSLLERLTLDDSVPMAVPDGGSSLRDRVGFAPHGSSEGGASVHGGESMDVDFEGNGDDGGKGGGRGQGRRRGGKPKRARRNGAS